MKTVKAKAGRPTIISDPRKRRTIARRYAAGEPLSQLSEEYLVCVDTIRRIAKSEGCPLRPVGRPKVTK